MDLYDESTDGSPLKPLENGSQCLNNIPFSLCLLNAVDSCDILYTTLIGRYQDGTHNISLQFTFSYNIKKILFSSFVTPMNNTDQLRWGPNYNQPFIHKKGNKGVGASQGG